MPNTRASEFRYIYSNVLGVQFNGAEFILTVGMKENQADPKDEMREEVSIILLPTTAKLWGTLLSSIIKSFEELNGVEVPIDPKKLEDISEIVGQAAKVAKTKKSSS